MPEYLSPGVYVEEFEIGARPIEGVSTSTAAFLGETERGPERPTLITGMEHYAKVFGGYLQEKYLTHAVDGFFKNGGKRCFVARIVSKTDSAPTMGGNDFLNISAVGPGAWGDKIAFKVEDGSLDPNNRFKLTVMYWNEAPQGNPPVDPTDPKKLMDKDRREPALLETYDNLTGDPTSVDFYERRVNGRSNLVLLGQKKQGRPPKSDLKLIKDGGTEGKNGEAVDVVDFKGRPLPKLPDGTVVRTGLQGLEEIDEVSLVCAPDYHTIDTLDQELVTHCTLRGDRFAILHCKPEEGDPNSVGDLRPPQVSRNAAFYFPWIKSYDPRTKREILIPPSGHVTGIYAKTDIERGVHKAPANEVVVGVTDLQFQVTKGEQDLLNPRGVNCLRSFPGRGIRVWGARTCSSDTLWKYVNVRRLFLYLEESIDKGTQWVVFEPNNEKLWGRVRATITEFLTRVWHDGALMGTKAEDAFFVKCDRTTMTQDEIDNGKLICVIGVAPVKPAEFVVFRIAQWAGGSAAKE